jgi:Cellulase (glycosyl hydrolase family 5)
VRPTTLRRGLVLGGGVTLAIAIGVVALARDDDRDTRRGAYTVFGNRILDSEGHRFVVKGVTLPYGTFAGGDVAGLGERNFAAARSDLRRVRALGANTARIMVTPQVGADPAALARLRRTVGWARDAGLVVELVNAFAGPRESLPWVARLARMFGADPGVWYEPMSEPNCAPLRPTCGDWRVWRREQGAYIRAIRAAGARAPIVVNTPSWSATLAGIDAFALGDRNVVYGVHAYANDRTAFAAGEEERAWGHASRDHAVVVDEVGSWNGPERANSEAWLAGLIPFVRDWVAKRGGAGAVAFVWRWSDPNTMTAPDGRLTSWGSLFTRGFLADG